MQEEYLNLLETQKQEFFNNGGQVTVIPSVFSQDVHGRSESKTILEEYYNLSFKGSND